MKKKEKKERKREPLALTNLLLARIFGLLLFDFLLLCNDPVDLDVDLKEVMDGVIEELLLGPKAIESNAENA